MNIRVNKNLVDSSRIDTIAANRGCLFIPKIAKYSTASVSNIEENGVNFFDIEFDYTPPTVKYGFVLNDYRVEEGIFKKNEFLSDVLMRYNVPYSTVDKVVKKAKDVFDVRKMRVGKEYMVLGPKDKSQPAQYIVYEPSAFRYVVYDLQNETAAHMIEHRVDTMSKSSSGVIYSNLWNAMVDNKLNYELAVKMEDALGYSIDFHHIKDNDKFKLIYDELYIEGKPVGIGQLRVAYFEHRNKEHSAYYFQDDAHEGYFDETGRPMKKAFLKAPVKYTRISSPFNLRRFHPVLRRVKAHLGTDYAAPRGTPIYAVAHGTVSRSGRTRGNGNFVKIKHDETYSSQYLHMNKIAPTARKGMKVKQGDVIGYVGSTGLATGPHVCFRFWKNGKQVDHRKENLPAPEPMSDQHLEAFKEMIKDYKTELSEIAYNAEKEVLAEKAIIKKTDP